MSQILALLFNATGYYIAILLDDADRQYYFDFASPNAYLSHKVIRKIKKNLGVEVNYIPVLLGGIFKATNNKPPSATGLLTRRSC